MPFFHLDKQQD